MTYEQRISTIKEHIKTLTAEEIVLLWNRHCEIGHYPYKIYHNDYDTYEFINPIGLIPRSFCYFEVDEDNRVISWFDNIQDSHYYDESDLIEHIERCDWEFGLEHIFYLEED